MCIISGLKSKSNKFWWTDRTYFHEKKNNFSLFFFSFCFQSFVFTQNFKFFFCNSITASSFHFGIFRAQQKCKIVLVSCTGSLLFIFFYFVRMDQHFFGNHFLILTEWSDFSHMPQHSHFISYITRYSVCLELSVIALHCANESRKKNIALSSLKQHTVVPQLNAYRIHIIDSSA